MRSDWYELFMTVMFIFLIGTIGLVVCIIAGEIGKAIYRKTLQYTTFLDQAMVCDKQYKRAHTTHYISRIGKVSVPRVVYHSASYKVYLRYKGDEYVINDKTLYEKVKAKDNISVFVHEGRNKKRELKHRYLSV